MNTVTFVNLLKDQAQLYKITYTELKGLVLQYPYCQNLRYLLLKKCMFEDHQDFEENLQLAASFSNNRNLLFKQIHKHKSIVHDSDTLNLKVEEEEPEEQLKIENESAFLEPVAETENIESIEKEHLNIEQTEPLAEIQEEKEEEENIETAIEISDDAPAYFDENDTDAEIEDITEEMEFEYDFGNIQTNAHDSTEDYKKVIYIEELIELDNLNQHKKATETKKEIPDKIEADKAKKDIPFREASPKEKTLPKKVKKKPPPTPKSSFGSWVKQFQEPEKPDKSGKSKEGKKVKKKHKKKDSVSKKQKTKKHEKKGKKSSALAEQSLKQNKEIATETLASLLALQGSFEEAIEMYERLSLIFPKKSSYFADQIKKLKNN